MPSSRRSHRQLRSKGKVSAASWVGNSITTIRLWAFPPTSSLLPPCIRYRTSYLLIVPQRRDVSFLAFLICAHRCWRSSLGHFRLRKAAADTDFILIKRYDGSSSPFP